MALTANQDAPTARRKGRGRPVVLSLLSALLGLGCFGLAWGVEHLLIRAEFYPLLSVQGSVYNRGMTLAARRAQESGRLAPVVVVAVDETTRERLKSVPSFLPGLPGNLRFRQDERAFHVRVLQNLRRLGAKVVAFDIVFDEEEPRLDPYVARAIREHGSVILAALDEQGVLKGGEIEKSHNLQYPVPDLRQAAAGIGLTNIPLDEDRAARRFWWWFTGIDDEANDLLIPSLGVGAAALYDGADPRTVITEEVRPHRTFLGRPIEWLPGPDSPTSFIRYFGPAGAPAGPGSRLPYEDVFFAFDPQSGPKSAAQTEWLRKQIAGKIVLIGDATAISQDYHRVPVLTRRVHEADTNQMAGVEIQAHITQTALQGKWVRAASPLAQVMLLLATCLLAAILGRWLEPGPFALAGALLFAGLYLGSIWLLSQHGYWIEPVTASFGLGITLFCESAFMFFAERKQRNRLRREFARQVGSRVAEALSEEDWPEVGGESREITMLFSDLKGFTSISENLSPPEICQLLNRYFGVVFPILFRYGGAVDKLMGDGVMAYFGWNERGADHAERAVRCAVEIQQALRTWQQRPENADLPPLLTRIGIHTGVATIGNVGSGERVEFTVIGDIVNVASRLEGMNKDFGTTLLISEATRDAAGDIVPVTFRGAAAVRGRKEPMPVYSVELETAPEAAAG